MKVRANDNFKWYRNVVLKLDKKDFRALQAGRVVDLKKEDVDKYPHIYEVVKESTREFKDGDK